MNKITAISTLLVSSYVSARFGLFGKKEIILQDENDCYSVYVNKYIIRNISGRKHLFYEPTLVARGDLIINLNLVLLRCVKICNSIDHAHVNGVTLDEIWSIRPLKFTLKE